MHQDPLEKTRRELRFVAWMAGIGLVVSLYIAFSGMAQVMSALAVLSLLR